jgi:hypothetical protein
VTHSAVGTADMGANGELDVAGHGSPPLVRAG